MALDVRHDVEAGRFYAEIEGATAYLDYVRVDERTLDFRSTFVPEALRGRGVAGEIVRFALNRARENGLRIIPSCSYVAATIRREPSFAEIVAH